MMIDDGYNISSGPQYIVDHIIITTRLEIIFYKKNYEVKKYRVGRY